jgi:DNA polymerase-1
MHMARLWDSSRNRLSGGGGYSLAALSHDLLAVPKTSMMDLFGVPKLKKDGTPSKQPPTLPPMDALQRDPATRPRWIRYAALDAEVTWRLHEALSERLSEMKWGGKPPNDRSMLDFFDEYIAPFGELLTDLERNGILVDTAYLAEQERRAEREREAHMQAFLRWASEQCPDGRLMNPSSGAQIQTLLFAPCANKFPKKHPTPMPAERTFDVDNVDGFVEPGRDKPKKKRPITLRGLGWTPVKFTASGWPATSADVLRTLATDGEGGPGRAMDFYGADPAEQARGREACAALEALCENNAIDTMLSTFLRPLQELPDAQGRIHCSLNLNTETGRLSARRPNLQNQPALEKDRYRIRSAFRAPPGKRLIVADYGQLELRILAHMAQCRSMIDAFRAGGDFHSRTAVGMYPHIQAALDANECLLEWDGSTSSGKEDGPPLPLVKDLFASERRKAKVLNFSIAYGKTAHGLAQDFGTSVKEARETLEMWYADRPEVREWQDHTIAKARSTGRTRTLMGRYRDLPDINSRNRAASGHSERAAINTPIQGGAADVVMKAMLKLHHDEELKALGWRMLLQIHDEVIIEGPEETAQAAQACLLRDMTMPFDKPLLVDLVVDSNIGQTWYEAK